MAKEAGAGCVSHYAVERRNNRYWVRKTTDGPLTTIPEKDSNWPYPKP